MAQSRLIKLLNVDPKFFYYNGNPNNKKNGGGLGNFTQKSIQPGSDRPGGSNSGQPYINTVIPQKPNSANAVDDGYIRGGATLANKASIIDKERIKKFLNDKPKGTLFIQRQTKLQFTNPKLEVKRYGNNGEGFLNGLFATVSNVVNEFVPGPTRLYNQGFNTLAQVGATAFGQHFDRHGLTPVQDDNSKYLAVAQFNNQGNGNNNRLVRLKSKLIKQVEPASNFLNSLNFIFGNVNALFGTNLSTKALQAPELTIDEYLGGPGSTYGNGRTLIRRFDITGNDPNFQNKLLPQAKGVINYIGGLKISTKWNSSRDINGSNYIPSVNNFSALNQTAVDYNKKNGIGSKNIPAGANGTSNSPTARNYLNLKEQVYNQIQNQQTYFKNKSIPYNVTVLRGDKDLAYWGTKRVNGKNERNKTTNAFNREDPKILSIAFTIYDPFNPSGANPITFPAYMQGFRDNFDGSWSEFNYVGRSETFYTYSKYKRTIGFTLDIPCFNKVELNSYYQRLGQLASTTAGTYNTDGLLGGVIMKLNIGKHVNGDFGILTNLSYEIPNESSWDLDAKLAMYIKATFSFNIVSAQLPEYKKGQGLFNNLKDTLPSPATTSYE
jgi:hypothetical protein